MAVMKAERIVQEYRFSVGAEPSRVFPLLCPVREYEWIDGWECQVVHTESGVVEEGCIFITDRAPEGKTIWVTAIHDPVARRVGFVRVTPDSHVSRMDLSVADEGGGHASVTVRYCFTALNERGQSVLAHISAGGLADRAARLGRSLDYFVRTGTMQKPFGGAGG